MTKQFYSPVKHLGKFHNKSFYCQIANKDGYFNQLELTEMSFHLTVFNNSGLVLFLTEFEITGSDVCNV